jgi:hypothetical protein
MRGDLRPSRDAASPLGFDRGGARAGGQPDDAPTAHRDPLASLPGAVGRAPWPGLADLGDAPIWATAVAAGARNVVSQNTADFPPLVDGRHVYQGIEYLTAIGFVEDMLRLDPGEVYGRPAPDSVGLRSGRSH